MKIQSGFLLRNIVDEWVVMPTGERALTIPGAMVLNEVAVVIWNALQTPTTFDSLLEAIRVEFDVDVDTAAEDLRAFLDQLRSVGALDED